MGNQEAHPRSPPMAAEMFQKVIDHIPVMLIGYDGAANPLFVNREFTRVLGWTLEEARKVDLMAECYPDPSYRKEARACMAGAEPGWKDFRVRARDGRIVEISWSNGHLADGSHIWIGIDVSETRRVERERMAEELARVGGEKARESEERYRSLFEGSTAAMLVIDPETGRIVDGNPASCRYYGYSHERIRSLKITDINGLPPDDISREMEKARSGKCMQFLFSHRLASGEVRPVEVFSTPISIEGKQLLLSIVHDITDRIRAEEELRKSEERYRMLFKSHPSPMWLYDLETLRFLAVNDAAIDGYGYTREEFLAMTIKDIRPPEDVPALLANVANVRDGLDRAGVWRHRRKDGSLIDVEITSHIITFDGRKAEIVLANDVTERLRQERVLAESEERFRSLADRMPQPVYETDASGRLTYMNLHGRNLFGYSEEDLAGGVSIFSLIDPTGQENGREAFRKRIEEGFEGPKEYLWVRKDGTKFPAIAYAASLLGKGSPAGTGGVLMDLSDLRKAENELIIAQKYEVVGRLAGGIAHHLNNLMTIVAGYGSLIIDRMGLHDPWRREVEEMRRAGERAATLTGQLLSYSRRQILQPEVIEPGTFLTEIEEELRAAAGPDVNLSVLRDPGGWTVRVDRDLLRNALLRLVENSRYAMPSGGSVVILSRKADVGGEGGPPVPSGKYAMISVTDTGVGMDAETRSRVFEPFFTTRRLGEGAGMSLPSVYGFVKQSKGYIFVESEPGKGATLSIYLPLEEP